MKRINISFYCLLISAMLVSLVITALLYKSSPIFASKTTFLCQKLASFSNLFGMPRFLPNAILFATGIILAVGFLSFLVQIAKTYFILRKLLVKRVNIPANLATIIEVLSLKKKVILVSDKNLFSFCFSTFPFIPTRKYLFIMLSTGLVKSLSDKELEAVLLHEQSHLISRDPIKVLIGKTFSSMFFFLPIFKELHKNIEAVNELLADQWTISRQKNSVFLRSAIKKILSAPQLNLKLVTNASGPDYFEVRIHRLINPGTKHKFRLSLVSLLTTFLFVLVSWFLLQAPVGAFHMDSMDDSAYHEGTSFAYFLCSENQSCSEQCHTDTEQSTSYIPAHLFLPEKRCDDDPLSSKTN